MLEVIAGLWNLTFLGGQIRVFNCHLGPFTTARSNPGGLTEMYWAIRCSGLGRLTR